MPTRIRLPTEMLPVYDDASVTRVGYFTRRDYTESAFSTGHVAPKVSVEIQFCDVEEWLSLADRRIPCDIGPYQVSDATGHLIRITPFLTVCRGLLILGGDWIPIRDTGTALLEQMVHTPGIYFGKAKNIRQ